jgi:hypothetical protein
VAVSVHSVDAGSPIITRSVYSVVKRVGVVAAPAIPDIGRNIAPGHGDGCIIDAGEGCQDGHDWLAVRCIIGTTDGGR